MKSVFITPNYNSLKKFNTSGIAQAVIRSAEHFKNWEITTDMESADLVAHHAGSSWETNGYLPPDVAHCHGLMPTGQDGFHAERWNYEVNRRVINDIRWARPFVTVPSEWVADVIARNMGFRPRIIPWAMHTAPRRAETTGNYVLWNKNRDIGVCTPHWLNELARRNPGLSFTTTFGNKRSNTLVTGKVGFDQMQNLLAHANIYLATTKETGDIGTMEALSWAVPILGFRHGAIVDIVEHGITGYLANPDDFDDLNRGLHWLLEHRETISQNILNHERAGVFKRTWADVGADIEQLYEEAYEEKHRVKTVSVIIPCHNYGNFLTDAVESVRSQTVDTDFEVIVVNDASTDNSKDIIDTLGVTAIHLTHNVGVAEARNTGIRAAKGDYILCLDADDMLSDGVLQQCFRALERDRFLGMAYVGLMLWDGEGTYSPHRWPGEYDADKQVSGDNTVHTACMFRKFAWESAGGYRGVYSPAEDAELWVRLTKLGYSGKKVTDEPLFIYRMHANSLTSKMRQEKRKEPDWVTDKVGMAAFASCETPRGLSHAVENYDTPMFSIIIPVGKPHLSWLPRALDSVFLQTRHDWECIVVYDMDRFVPDNTVPWARHIPNRRKAGAGGARNSGIDIARGKFVVFLDADDELHPEFLESTLQQFHRSGGYIYTDYYIENADGSGEIRNMHPFTPERIFQQGFFHAVTALVPIHEAQRAMFDEELSSYEDVEFFMRLIANGLCGEKVDRPLLKYRIHTGYRREHGKDNHETHEALFRERYSRYMNDKEIPVCQCSEQANKTNVPNTSLDEYQDLVLARYIGPNKGRQTIRGSFTGQQYRLKRGDIQYVRAADLGDTRLFEQVEHYEPAHPPQEMPDVG